MAEASNKIPTSSYKPAPRIISDAFAEPFGVMVGRKKQRSTKRDQNLKAVSNSYALAESGDPNLRSGGGDYEDVTNRLQNKLLRVYDSWAVGIRDMLVSSNDKGINPDRFPSMVGGRISELEKGLVSSLSEGINAAALVAIGSVGTSSRTQLAINTLANQAADTVRTSTVRNIRERLTKHLSASQQFDRSSLKGIFDTNRASVSQLSGFGWTIIFGALRAAGREQEQSTGQTQRVRWVLNDLADHCSASPGRFGCPELARVYGSWAELQTVPAADVTCRGNCRCRLEVETEPGSNTWVRGLPGFNP